MQTIFWKIEAVSDMAIGHSEKPFRNQNFIFMY